MMIDTDLIELLQERKQWFKVRVVPSKSQTGWWDVVLTIDGSYKHKEEAERLARYFASKFEIT